MRKVFFILMYIFYSTYSWSQIYFKTVIPIGPVAVGESFQVQYIIQAATTVENFKAPDFKQLRLISGPHQYNGIASATENQKPVRNIVFTLEATETGQFSIPGASAIIDGKEIRSNDAVLRVVSKQQVLIFERSLTDVNGEYILKQGEDPYQKISKNIFLNVQVDRTTCFVGEPILATFNLYSRLESKSDVIKNPGFYGFTVFDIVNLNDKQLSVEKMNGKLYDVHTIRKVQLFPLSEGQFTIDPMEVKNKISFSTIPAYKKLQQQISEGILGKNDRNDKMENINVYEYNLNSSSITIRVLPLPIKNKPDGFSGAVGQFIIAASVVKDQLAKNEEGILNLTITGKGNFTQVSAPKIKWPEGVEGFEPIVKDSLEKNNHPLTGSRIFQYNFIGNTPGFYQLPAIDFCYFDPASKSYNSISSSSIPVQIKNENVNNLALPGKKISITEINTMASRIAAAIIISLTALVFFYWIRYKNKPVAGKIQETPNKQSVRDSLMPARLTVNENDKIFLTALYNSIWNYLGQELVIQGSQQNKSELIMRLEHAHIEQNEIQALKKILSECEKGMFTNASLEINKEEMMEETTKLLESIQQKLF